MNIEPAILYYCKYQERCHSEVRNKLYELGMFSVTVDEQIALLIEAGHLNEERFARAYARGRWRLKQWGRVKIRQQLRLKKVSEYCIKKGLSEIDEQEYFDKINEIAAKKALELAKERSILSKKAKISRFLLQRGYEQDIVSDLVAQIK